MIGLLRRPRTGETAPKALPEGVRVYAVGDIHGHLELLLEMMDMIAEDLRLAPHPAPVEVFLGDLVDRGPDSRGVVEALAAAPPEGRTRVCLKGNHEQALIDFLGDAEEFLRLADFGGIETLASYGLPFALLAPDADPEAAHAALLERCPQHHLAFLKGLPVSHRIGEVLFAHAGIRPGVPLEEQSEEDLIWIREPFLRHPGPLPVRVVHGHTPVREPTVLPHRINVDTGAFATGRLTCAVLEGSEVRFLSTG